jgi:hypothetical protein
VRRPSDEGVSGRSVWPVSEEADVPAWRLSTQRQSRRHGLEDDGRGGHRCTHAARSTGAALELGHLVQVVQCKSIFSLVSDSYFMVMRGQSCLGVTVPNSGVPMRVRSFSRRCCQHAMVVRPATDHGRRSKALQGQSQQQEPHQRSVKTQAHGMSVDRLHNMTPDHSHGLGLKAARYEQTQNGCGWTQSSLR